jgi:hypothetical protein
MSSPASSGVLPERCCPTRSRCEWAQAAPLTASHPHPASRGIAARAVLDQYHFAPQQRTPAALRYFHSYHKVLEFHSEFEFEGETNLNVDKPQR